MKLLKKIGLVVVVCLAMAMHFGTNAMAQGGAAIIDPFGCFVPDANFDLWPCDTADPGNKTHVVITPSGNTNFMCSCDLPEGAVTPENKSEVYSDFMCGTQSGLTFDSHAVVTKSGRVKLTCTIHPQ